MVRIVSLPARQEQRARLDRLDRDPDVLMELAKRVAEGVSEYEVAHDFGVGLHRFRKWLHEPGYPERLQEYEFALKAHGRVMVRDAVEIADNDSPFVQRDRLRVETRLKVAPLYEPQFREAKGGVNISVGGGGSLIAILAGMDTHGQVPAEPQHRVIEQSGEPESQWAHTDGGLHPQVGEPDSMPVALLSTDPMGAGESGAADQLSEPWPIHGDTGSGPDDPRPSGAAAYADEELL